MVKIPKIASHGFFHLFFIFAEPALVAKSNIVLDIKPVGLNDTLDLSQPYSDQAFLGLLRPVGVCGGVGGGGGDLPPLCNSENIKAMTIH